MSNLFFYGTLRHLPLLELVLGRPISELVATPAVLQDHAVYGVKDQIFPMILKEKGSTVDGLLVQDLSVEDLERLAFYEGGFDYDLSPQQVECEDGSILPARVFYPQPDLWTRDQAWSLQGWVDRWAEVSLLAAEEVMALYGTIETAVVAQSYPSILMRAWARLLNRQRGNEDQGDAEQDVIVKHHERPYVGYFGMGEMDLQHRKYDGSMSPVLRRSALMQGAAAIVLPYDPVRDTVLLVEQFRAPVFMSDDSDPWLWEPVAGMVDPGETPEQTAYREVREEAHVSLNRLEYVGGAYSSTGSSTEYVYLYVGLADLTGTVEGVGVATEGEDIRSKILPFGTFMDKVDAHVFKDLKLLTLAHWLARHRDRLRA